jgi:hypothetical protein
MVEEEIVPLQMRKKQAQITCLSVLVCDDFFRDATTQKLAIWGTFNEIRAEATPCRHPRLCVVVTITSGRGVRNVGVAIETASTEKAALVEMAGPMEFKSPLDIVEIGLAFQNLIFPEFGKYFVCIKEDGTTLAQRPFHVKKLKKPRKPRKERGTDAPGND